MGYVLTNLGLYKQYSDDPRIRNGVVVAARDRSSIRFSTQAAYWDGNWHLLPDPLPDTERSVARNINSNLTQIVGHYSLKGSSTKSRAAIWSKISEAWQVTTLPLPQEYSISIAIGNSDSGSIICGSGHPNNKAEEPLIWSVDKNSQWTPDLLPFPNTRGYAIGEDNLTGDVVGNIIELSVWRAVRWIKSGTDWHYELLDTSSMGEGGPEKISSDVNCVCEGVCAGAIRVGDGNSKAVIWNINGSIQDLRVGDHTEAHGYRNGTVTGTDSSSGVWKGFAWDETKQIQDIHPPGWDWSFPNDVDHDGTIVGVMGMGIPRDANAEKQIYILTPDQSFDGIR